MTRRCSSSYADIGITGRCGPPHAPDACVLPITPHSRKSGGRESVYAPLRSALNEAPLELQRPAVSLTPPAVRKDPLLTVGGKVRRRPLPSVGGKVRPALSPMSYRPGMLKQKDRLSGFPSKRSLKSFVVLSLRVPVFCAKIVWGYTKTA